MKDRRIFAVGLAALVLGFGLGWVGRGALVLRAAGSTEAVAGAADGATGGEAGEGGEALAARADGGAEGGGATAAGRAAGDQPDEAGADGTVAVVGGGEASGRGASGAAAGDGAEADGAGEGAQASADGGVPRVLNADSIRDVVRDNRDQLGFCFAWQLHEHPELGGRITMELEIDAQGRVTQARVADDTVGDETVARCFGSVARRMEFPPSEGDGVTTVRYPFELRADDDGAESSE